MPIVYDDRDWIDQSASAAKAAKAAKKAQNSTKKANTKKALDTAAAVAALTFGGGLKASAVNNAVSFLNDAYNGNLKDAVNKAVSDPILNNPVTNKIGEKISDALNKSSSKSPTGRGSGYGSGSSVAGSAVNTGYDSYLDMLHAEQERVWNREDTAYQRTVKDLQAAGLNPVLAVSGGMSPVGGSSSSSDSQVVGAVAELASMAISGLTETAKGVSNLAAISSLPKEEKSSFISKAGKWYKSNANTIRTAVSTAASIAKLFAI